MLLSQCLHCFKTCQKTVRPGFHSKGMGMPPYSMQIILAETKKSLFLQADGSH